MRRRLRTRSEIIVNEIDRVAELVATITSASLEQAEALSRSERAYLRCRWWCRRMQPQREESAAASVELSEQADQLRQTVSVFKIKLDGQRKPGKPG